LYTNDTNEPNDLLEERYLVIRFEESSRVELKRELNADFKKEIIALANTNGGEILIGVEKSGIVCGIENQNLSFT
jgi:predicted HTH transcriptional regulator